MIDYAEEATRLVSLLGKGRANAISRTELLEEFGGKDREMRKVIAYARLMGFCINNDQDKKGYYIPETLEELERQYKQTEERGKAIFAQLKSIRRQIDKIRSANQLCIPGIGGETEGV